MTHERAMEIERQIEGVQCQEELRGFVANLEGRGEWIVQSQAIVARFKAGTGWAD